MESTYTKRTQLILIALFIHYMGYLIFLILDSLDYPKRIRISYGLRNKNAIKNWIENIWCLGKKKKPAVAQRAITLENAPLSQPQNRINAAEPGSEERKDEAQDAEEIPREFLEHETKYTKFIKGHYLKNNFFFFVGCVCAILAGSSEYTIILIYSVLGIRILELFGLSCGLLWISYIAHTAGALINYANIINAINYFSVPR